MAYFFIPKKTDTRQSVFLRVEQFKQDRNCLNPRLFILLCDTFFSLKKNIFKVNIFNVFTFFSSFPNVCFTTCLLAKQ